MRILQGPPPFEGSREWVFKRRSQIHSRVGKPLQLQAVHHAIEATQLAFHFCIRYPIDLTRISGCDQLCDTFIDNPLIPRRDPRSRRVIRVGSLGAQGQIQLNQSGVLFVVAHGFLVRDVPDHGIVPRADGGDRPS